MTSHPPGGASSSWLATTVRRLLESKYGQGRVPGVRAALCGDAETARGARRWNDANVLAFGLRLTSAAVAAELLDAFFDEELAPDPDKALNIAKLG